MAVCTKNLEVEHISALVASYVALRLSEVHKSGAWSPKTIEYMFGPSDQPVVRPFPPPPPPFQEMLADLAANLLDPTRPDLTSGK